MIKVYIPNPTEPAPPPVKDIEKFVKSIERMRREMSCPHGEWHEEDCQVCTWSDEVFELKEKLTICKGANKLLTDINRKLLQEGRELERENAKLQIHIERWADDHPDNYDLHTEKIEYDDLGREIERHDFCWYWEVKSPCPWEVAKGLE